jgi:hypothetical protein
MCLCVESTGGFIFYVFVCVDSAGRLICFKCEFLELQVVILPGGTESIFLELNICFHFRMLFPIYLIRLNIKFLI